MKHLNSHLLLTLLIAFSIVGQSQNCYNVIADMSGIDIKPYQEQLETAACELVEAIPSQFRDQFKVYDFEFYSLNENMEGGFQTIWDKVINEIPTEYYLIYGKQSDHNGIFSKFWVDIKLPFDQSCIDNITLQNIVDNTRWSTEDEYANNGKNPFNYSSAEIIGMNYLKEKINYIVLNCCVDNLPSICSNCPDDLTI